GLARSVPVSQLRIFNELPLGSGGSSRVRQVCVDTEGQPSLAARPGVDPHPPAAYEGRHPTQARRFRMNTEHVVVVGAGQMGAGIAQVVLQSGLKVTLIDVAKQVLDKGSESIRSGLQKLQEKGKLEEAKRKSALERLRTAAAISEVRDVDFAIEAV